MAGGKERVLRRRIKSVQSTKKITRAMELIAATRVMSAQQRAAAARPYSEQITSVIEHLAAAGASLDHPLLRPGTDTPQRIAYVVITSDRGLAGAYNSGVIRAAEREILDRRADGIDYRLVLVGKKAQGYFAFRNYRIHAAYVGMSDTPTYEHAREVAQTVSELFLSGEVDQVQLVYTRFLSMGSQRVVVRRFMPLEASGLGAEGPAADYEFEPQPAAILDALLPRYVEARLYAALLDAAASEHAARQRAMKSATDNAEDLIVRLSRVMNRARQDAITTEIMEIVGGAEALAQGEGGPEDLLVDRIGAPEFFAQMHPPHDDRARHHAGA